MATGLLGLVDSLEEVRPWSKTRTCRGFYAVAPNAGLGCRVSWEGGHDARRGRRDAVPPLDVQAISVSGKKGKSDAYDRLRKSLWNVGANLVCTPPTS